MRKANLQENVRVVTTNSFITAHGLTEMSVNARKLLYIAIAQSKLKDNDFYEFSMTANEFADFLQIDPKTVYNVAFEISSEVLNYKISIKNKAEKEFATYNLFSSCKYAKGVLSFKLSDDLKPIVLELKRNFMQPLLSDFAGMKSRFGVSLWHLLQREMHSKKAYANYTHEVELGIDEIRIVTGTINKLKQVGQLKEKCLDIACRDIANCTGNRVTYTDIKQGRRIVGFRFWVTSLYYQSDLAD